MVFRAKFPESVCEKKKQFCCLLHIQCFFHCKDDVFDLWYAVVLQNLCVWHGDVHSGNSDSRGIQVVERRTYGYKKKSIEDNLSEQMSGVEHVDISVFSVLNRAVPLQK